jgi:hypothetical protein
VFRAAAALCLVSAISGCDAPSRQSQGASQQNLPPVAAGEKERCYGRKESEQAARLASAKLDRDVLVLVDQTTLLPSDVKQNVIERVSALATPGTRISVGTFSSYTDNAHSQMVFESLFEPSYPQERRADAPMKALKVLDQCLEERRQSELGRLRSTLSAAADSSRTDVARSDILASVKSFGRRLEQPGAPDRILILVSDLLENSTATSFYGAGRMRKIDPDAELAKVEKSDLSAKLDQVRVFVIGGGLPPPGAKAERSIDDMNRLERFWTGWFKKAGAKGVEIGEPRLHDAIG